METAQNKIVKAALLGAGTVGSGVYQLVQERQEDFSHICGTQIQITKILVRDASKEREGIPFLQITGMKLLKMTVFLLLLKLWVVLNLQSLICLKQ